MKVNLSKCPVCGDNYGELRTAEGSVENLYCRCQHRFNSCIAINGYIVGIGFVSLLLIQFEKNIHMLKKIVDLLHNLC
jgi:hypothetical protein